MVNNQPTGCHLVECRHPPARIRETAPCPVTRIYARIAERRWWRRRLCTHACTRTYVRHPIDNSSVAGPPFHFQANPFLRCIPRSASRRMYLKSFFLCTRLTGEKLSLFTRFLATFCIEALFMRFLAIIFGFPTLSRILFESAGKYKCKSILISKNIS